MNNKELAQRLVALGSATVYEAQEPTVRSMPASSPSALR